MAAGAFGSVSNRSRHENGDTHVGVCDDVFSDAGSTPAASTIRLGRVSGRGEWCPERAIGLGLPFNCESKGLAHGLWPSHRQSRLNVTDDGIVVCPVMHFVYILRCADTSLYIGETDDLQNRIARHQEGRACAYTAARRPVEVVYIEELANHLAARRRERQLKGWTRRKKEALVAGDFTLLKRL